MFCPVSFLHRFIGTKGSLTIGVMETANRKGSLSRLPAFSVVIEPANMYP